MTRNSIRLQGELYPTGRKELLRLGKHSLFSLNYSTKKAQKVEEICHRCLYPEATRCESLTDIFGDRRLGLDTEKEFAIVEIWSGVQLG